MLEIEVGEKDIVAVGKPINTALILYTSGTTGKPKLVPLSHSNMIASIENIVATYDLSPSDCTYAIMPLFHVHGMMASVLATLGSGGSIVLPSTGRFSPSVFWQELNGNKCTWVTAVPTMHQILLQVKVPAGFERHCLRFIRSCSSALAPAILDQMEKRYGVDVLEAYAMTEACHQMTSNPMEGTYRRRPGTVGISHGGVSIKILDGRGTEALRGNRGEICVKGSNVMTGYMNNEAANKEAFAGEYFRTGDEGVMDRDGFITITGRIKELINRGGEKISPLEIDAVLLSHPSVSEAVCFGIQDPKYGEVVGAVVVPKKGRNITEAEIITFVKSKVASFKVPVKVFIADQLPRTATGKIQRRLVAKHFLERSNL
jgi:acyl-CoA synthetase (AMP-forming)/AMP-acid ligase II